jgi:subtilisin family serine protease
MSPAAPWAAAPTRPSRKYTTVLVAVVGTVLATAGSAATGGSAQAAPAPAPPPVAVTPMQDSVDVPGARMALSVSAQRELARHGIVVDLSSPVSRLTATDPMRSQQWGLDAASFPAGNLISTGTGVIVGVVDSGVARTADFGTRVLTGTDFLADGDGTADANGHGTGVASIIAATAADGIGMTGGAPSVRILPVRVCNAAGSCPSDALAAGILWAVDHGAQVINASVGGGGSPGIAAAVAYAEAHSVTFVAAAGNAALNGNPVMYPAGYPTAVAVGAVGQALTRASFSEYGPQIDLAGPGESIVVALPNGTYANSSGTSQASPHVAAAAALLKSLYPAATPAEIRSVLASTATDLGASGRDDQYGAGIVNAGAAATLMRATYPNAQPPVPPANPAQKVPTVASVSPSMGSLAGGTTVKIAGTNFFSADPSNPAAVTFGGIPAASFTVVSATKITAVTPDSAVNGAAAVVVSNLGGPSVSKVTFAYRSALGGIVTAAEAKATGGTSIAVTVTGGGVGATAKAFAAEKITAKIGGQLAAATWTDETHVRLIAPASKVTGPVSLQIIHDSLPGPVVEAAVVYVATIDRLSVTSGPTAGGTKVVVSGKWLYQSSNWMLGSVPASCVAGGTVTAPILTCTTGAVASAGPVSFTFTAADGSGSGVTAAATFTYADLG